MKLNTMLIAVLAVVAGIIFAVVVNVKHTSTPVAAPIAISQPATTIGSHTGPTAPTSSPSEITTFIPARPVNPVQSNATVKSTIQANTAPADQPLMINGYEVHDPTARVALSFVGADPDADAYWAGAINDPNLPSEERKDLIEDLNEDGLSDPKHPGPQDIPLIVNRLRLIEELGPSAMDQVNADAFQEAYKDLVNMLNGQPVQ